MQSRRVCALPPDASPPETSRPVKNPFISNALSPITGLGTGFDSLAPALPAGAETSRGEALSRPPDPAPAGRAKGGIVPMKIVMAIIKPFKLDEVRDALTGTR